LIGTRVPVVYRQISDPQFWAPSWSRRLRVAVLLRRMKAVVALSAETASTLKGHYRLRRRPPVRVIPNAVSEGRFRPATPRERAEARAILGLPPDCGVILFIGALTTEKGVDLAITACAELPAAVLLVVGEGPQRRDFEILASRCLPHRCLFAGSLDDPVVAYRSADLLIFPSRSESMPAVLIEAGLCGLASVSTDVGSIREVIDHGTTGLVVARDDTEALASAVAALMRDPARRLAMGDAALARCSERFTIGRVAPMWTDLLSGLPAGPRSTR
jgi:glycosyltransferase involved in cell wall biosynthesis